jgi:hypothetical protein
MRAVAMVLTLIAFAASVGYVIALMPCQQPRALPPPRRSAGNAVVGEIGRSASTASSGATK